VTHVLNLLVSRLTSADVQSTITPDEGRNVPWHYNNVAAVETAKQALLGMDGLQEMVEIKNEGPLPAKVRELAERAVLFLEEIKEKGYFSAVQEGFFVDSGEYPERHGDGIARDPNGGVAAGSIVKREPGYFAPVCHHYGINNLPGNPERPASLSTAAPSAAPRRSSISMSWTPKTMSTGGWRRWSSAAARMPSGPRWSGPATATSPALYLFPKRKMWPSMPPWRSPQRWGCRNPRSSTSG
jgi:hypothetical protein